MASNGYRSMSLKASVAASAAVLSAAVAVHLSWPSIVRFGSSEVPKIYCSLVSWLTPPYLYFVINGIIISIAASSRFHKPGSDSELLGSGPGSEVSVASPIVVKRGEYVAPPVVVLKPEYVVPTEYAVPTEYTVPEVVQMKPEYVVPAEYTVPAVFSAPVEMKEEYVAPAEYTVLAEFSAPVEVETEYVAPAEEENKEEEFVISRSSWTPKRRESTTEIPPEYSFLKAEKPLVSSRLGRRKSIKSSPEAGRGLGVARQKRNETLESTWKTITDGRPVPLTRHLKKSDTWETHHDPASLAERQVRKSETFNERNGRKPASAAAGGSPLTTASARLRKEPSLGQDDLNRRVEAFIKKFNEEMRLQRQDSFNHYVDMINRGSH